jgi:inosine/xanthosine triphosphatase
MIFMSKTTKIVTVGSVNPVKISAATKAFTTVWPNIIWQVSGIEIASGVSSQPMSDDESIKGARNRALGAQQKTEADYGVGIEGGIQPIGDLWFDCGWMVVVNRSGIEGIGSTARIITPPKMISLIKQGKELGYVVDELFNTVNAKHNDGHFGLMTNQAITRTSGYRDGVIMALVRFLHPELW